MVRLLFREGICCLILASLWIVRFSEQVSVELPLLMDYDGKVSTDWKIYVYPSSYLVDHQGKIRYAYLGALEWDSTETIKIIQSLLNRP